jgi:hypothetical protein
MDYSKFYVENDGDNTCTNGQGKFIPMSEDNDEWLLVQEFGLLPEIPREFQPVLSLPEKATLVEEAIAALSPIKRLQAKKADISFLLEALRDGDSAVADLVLAGLPLDLKTLVSNILTRTQ